MFVLLARDLEILLALPLFTTSLLVFVLLARDLEILLALPLRSTDITCSSATSLLASSAERDRAQQQQLVLDVALLLVVLLARDLEILLAIPLFTTSLLAVAECKARSPTAAAAAAAGP